MPTPQCRICGFRDKTIQADDEDDLPEVAIEHGWREIHFRLPGDPACIPIFACPVHDWYVGKCRTCGCDLDPDGWFCLPSLGTLDQKCPRGHNNMILLLRLRETNDNHVHRSSDRPHTYRSDG